MEVEVKGAAHCSIATCHRLDFLPFRCDACNGVYCQDHFPYGGHQCTKAGADSVQVIVCPICEVAERIRTDEDPNLTWDRHFTQSCNQRAPEKSGPKRCPVDGCREKMGPSNRFDCQRCGQTFCIKHRLQEDHDCRPLGSVAPGAAMRPSVGLGASGQASQANTKKKKSWGQRVGSMFACFSSSQKKSLLSGRGSTSE
eukprot:TRINITY_DN33398_c0_g1_i1.p1 TRINITY_DN33398_c0_g1~~TRINITY_DN33398_c0_g1_i1.p1  ORF type:complete len:198 (-),score=19.89 TRINITY_DN33398_c0_g1_i1:189-782(-)